MKSMIFDQDVSPLSNSLHVGREERRLGTGFLLLALFSAILGGLIALPLFSPSNIPIFFEEGMSSGALVSHVVLLSFFVICPATMGAMAQWLLPSALQTQHMALSGLSKAAWLLLALGVVFLPIYPRVGLGFWALGMVALSLGLIGTILEERRIGFAEFSPFVWSILWSASTVLFVAPVIAALLFHNMLHGESLFSVLPKLVVPELDLVLLPALGVVSLQKKRGVFWRLAPYLLGIMAVVPVLWAGSMLGQFPAFLMTYVVLCGLVLPGLCFLLLFCSTIWRASVLKDAGLPWRVIALVFLVCGFLQFLAGFFHLNVTAMGFHSQSGRQILIFGCLFSLAVGFYAWLEAQSQTTILRYYSGFHAGITSMGVLCFLSPNLVMYGMILMGVSVLCFIVAGLWAVSLFFRSEAGRSAQRQAGKGAQS